MSPTEELWTCPHCGAVMNIAPLGYYTEVECTQCAQHSFVHTRIGNYSLQGILGIGGMSVVFRAEDDVLKRSAAIKVLDDAYQNEPDRISKFAKECELMAKVRHGNVVSLYSAGWDGAKFYIAMEKVTGKNLETIIKRKGFMMPADALDVVGQVASGLQAAYDAGVMHRDIKPGNVIITRDNQAKVLDFGLSQEAQKGEAKDEMIWATPFYASPETLRGEPEDLRADIYSLGMMLRNLLTGEDSLDCKKSVTVEELLAAKKRIPTMRTKYPRLPEQLSDLVDHLTAFEPTSRPATYAEVLDEIEEVEKLVGGGSLHRLNRARKRRSKQLTVLLSSTVVAGFTLAVCLALFTPPQKVQQYVLPSSTGEWADVTILERAAGLVASGKYEEASDTFYQLAASSQEPALGVASALISASIRILNGAPADKKVENALAIFERHISRAEQAAPASRELMQKFVDIAAIMKQCDEEKSMPRPSQLQPLPVDFRVAVLAIQMRELAISGEMDKSERLRKGLKKMLQDESSALQYPLLESVDAFENHLPELRALARFRGVWSSMNRGDFSKALSSIDKIDMAHLQPVEQLQMQISKECCLLAMDLYEAMQKKLKDEFDPTASPELIYQQALKASDSRLFAEEIRSIAYMVKGDFEKAFETNPYRTKPNSSVRFAVMMRDWKRRLDAQ